MVKKLFKHEILYYMRALLPMYVVLFGVAVMGRVIAIFETDSEGYYILRGSSITALVVAAIVAVLLSMIFCIFRFYKNLFSGEGYLTMTLPVTPTQQLWVKWLVAGLAIVTTVAAVVLAVCIFTLGGWFKELWLAALYILREAMVAVGYGNGIFYILEFLGVALVAVLGELMMLYMCICVGQIFRKNRVLGAVGVYFALYLITQVLSTILLLVLTLFGEQLHLDELTRMINLHSEEFLHIFLCGGMVISAGISTVYFLICRYILTKKLNLE